MKIEKFSIDMCYINFLPQPHSIYHPEKIQKSLYRETYWASLFWQHWMIPPENRFKPDVWHFRPSNISDVIFSSFEWFTSFVHIHWHEVLHVVHLVHSLSTSEWEMRGLRTRVNAWTNTSWTMNYDVVWRMCTRIYKYGPSRSTNTNKRMNVLLWQTTYYIYQK